MLSGFGIFAAIAFVGLVWILFVIPAEKKHHKRRLELLQKRIREKETEQMAESSETESS